MAVTILPFVQEVMIRYFMSIYFALGLIGNICNFIVFLKQSRQRNACSIYLLCLSVFAFIYLVWSTIPFLYTLDHIDPQIQSIVYCKIRLYGSHILGLCYRYSIVFACVDRFFITRTSVRIRSWSSIEKARKIIPVVYTICIVSGVHIPVFLDIRDGVCGLFDFYKFVYPIYQCIVIGTVPPVLMGTFGYLTVRSLYQRHAGREQIRRKDRDLMRMVVAEIMINILLSIPYSAYLLYGTATFFVVDKSAERLEIEAFLNFLANFFINLLEVTPFYLFIISSKTFRHEFRQILKDWWYKYILRHTQITPLNDQCAAVISAPNEATNRHP